MMAREGGACEQMFVGLQLELWVEWNR